MGMENPLRNPLKWQPQKSIHFNVSAWQNTADAIIGTCCYPMLANRWPEQGTFHLPLEHQSLGTSCQCSSHQIWCRGMQDPSVSQRVIHIIKMSCGTRDSVWDSTSCFNIKYQFSSFYSFKQKTKNTPKHPFNRFVVITSIRLTSGPVSVVWISGRCSGPFGSLKWIFFTARRFGFSMSDGGLAWCVVSSAFVNYYRLVVAL